MGIVAIFEECTGATFPVATFEMVLASIPWGVVADTCYQKPCCKTINCNTNQRVTIAAGNSTRLTVNVPPFQITGEPVTSFGLLAPVWAIQVCAIAFAVSPL